ncbi:hypothetical protein MPK66_gp261 [Erwinia phage pEa_SNUABM_2]|uniref:Uncharacterized protein n=1 Tax=Erwinia phage pEa_SNUABM_2 TaxID=2869547 RepID=A0AAE7XPZ9_9CAUD|nr:hypothetical protein MPK66_gp261 [Erwinia phage pEa_SNUABM_2]QZE59505.1 hypothetical protein pEaSNUABM2_00261 [Erwinia phage pEa_SNUABM_2]QZE59842.1 hypothetical protein pEaSNUABM39_00262 [Erwinia phage pEa_SNUABM_39]
MPILPRCDMRSFLLDSLTGIKVPVTFDTTNIIKIHNQTCGSLQMLTVADMILWSSFEPERFTLYIERISTAIENTSAQQAAELCK